MRYKADRDVQISKLHDVPVLLGTTRIEGEPIARHIAQTAEQEIAFRTRRTSLCISRYRHRGRRHALITPPSKSFRANFQIEWTSRRGCSRLKNSPLDLSADGDAVAQRDEHRVQLLRRIDEPV